VNMSKNSDPDVGLNRLQYVTTCVQTSVSQPPGRGPVPDPDINYTGPRDVLLEFFILGF